RSPQIGIAVCQRIENEIIENIAREFAEVGAGESLAVSEADIDLWRDLVDQACCGKPVGREIIDGDGLAAGIHGMHYHARILEPGAGYSPELLAEECKGEIGHDIPGTQMRLRTVRIGGDGGL